jgi:hypothetical protein
MRLLAACGLSLGGRRRPDAIANLMTPPRCPARAAATVIRRQRTAVGQCGHAACHPLTRTSHPAGSLPGQTRHNSLHAMRSANASRSPRSGGSSPSWRPAARPASWRCSPAGGVWQAPQGGAVRARVPVRDVSPDPSGPGARATSRTLTRFAPGGRASVLGMVAAEVNARPGRDPFLGHGRVFPRGTAVQPHHPAVTTTVRDPLGSATAPPRDTRPRPRERGPRPGPGSSEGAAATRLRPGVHAARARGVCRKQGERQASGGHMCGMG